MKKGDHLVSPRIGYSHHGLYIGDRKVVHYSGLSESFNKGSVEITTLDEFAQGNDHDVKIHLIQRFNADERVERAMSKLGEDSYNAVFNNCEHFVNWCFFGLKISSQVNVVAATAGTFGKGYLIRSAAPKVMSALVVGAKVAPRATVITIIAIGVGFGIKKIATAYENRGD
jgi:hypothetical protein